MSKIDDGESAFTRVDWRKLTTDNPFEQMMIDSARAGLVMLGYNADGKLAAKLTEHGRDHVENEMLAFDADGVRYVFMKQFTAYAAVEPNRALVEDKCEEIAYTANKYAVDLRPTIVRELLKALMA